MTLKGQLHTHDLTIEKTIGCIKEVAGRYLLDAVEVTHHGFIITEI